MMHKIEQFIFLKQLLQKEDKVIVAVSGGLDSMVLLTLLHQMGYEIVAAHCNYKLRENESDLDEELVSEYCKKLNIKFYVQHVPKIQTIEDSGMGIQEFAREFRYKWFEKLLTEIGFNKIATAHHLDDQLETILFNLVRGTGLNGIRGIAFKKDNLVRPLLCVEKAELVKIASEMNIPFRTDKTNLETKYTRNKIRLLVLPELKHINKNAALHAQELSEWASYHSSNLLHNSPENLNSTLQIETIKKQSYPTQYLLEQLKPYGFNKYQIDDLLLAVLADSFGKQFESTTHRIYVNKNTLEIVENLTRFLSPICIQQLPYKATINGVEICIECVKNGINLKQENCLFIGLQYLNFPIILSKIEAGDLFRPFGMIGHKTIGNYFTDRKTPHEIRNKAFKLIIHDKIAAVVPVCIDNAFAVDETAKIVLKITY